MSKPTIYVDSIVLNSGDYIEFNIVTINNSPWYEINHHSLFNISSYYQGNDFERAFNFYKEILLAFKGVRTCEEFSKRKDEILKYIETEYNNKSNDDVSLKIKSLFLGMNDF